MTYCLNFPSFYQSTNYILITFQEKEGGSRSSLEDTPEKALKTTVSPRPTRRTTRIAAQAAAAIITTVHESTRKNARGGRKPAPKLETTPPIVTENLPVPAAEEEEDEFPASPATSSASSTSPSNVVPSSPVSARISTEPTNLIDPVSGLLIPMKEAEEGQYVPALTELNQLVPLNMNFVVKNICPFPTDRKEKLGLLSKILEFLPKVPGLDLLASPCERVSKVDFGYVFERMRSLSNFEVFLGELIFIYSEVKLLYG